MLRLPLVRKIRALSIELRCLAALCGLVLATYLPVPILSLSIDPLPYYAGLTSSWRGGLIDGTPTIDPNVGTTTEALGALSAQEWLQGRAPWWNPYTGAGMPLAAEMQSSSLFLPFVLLLRLPHGALYLKLAMQMLAALATFLLLRELRLPPFAAFVGGALYSFNGTFAWFSHAAILPVPFLPMLLLGIERARAASRRQRQGGWLLVAAAVAYSLYAGFPETAYLDGLLGAAWTAVRLFSLHSLERWRFFGKTAAGLACGLLLALPALVPFFEYLRQSGVSHSGFNQGGLPSLSLLMFLFPYVFGPVNAFAGVTSTADLATAWGNIGGYLPLTLVFLACVAVVFRGRDGALRGMLALTVILLVARCITFGGLFSRLFALLPGADLLAIVRYSEPAFELSAVVLAAYALDDWFAGRLPATHRSWGAALVATLALASCAAWLGRDEIARLWHLGHHYRVWLRAVPALAALTLVAAAGLIARPRTIRRAWLFGSVIVAEAMALFALPLLSASRDITVDHAPVEFLTTHLGLQRFYSLNVIHPNYSAYFRLASVDHSMLPVPANWTGYVHSALGSSADPVNFDGSNPPPAAAREAALLAHLNGFENTGVKYVVTAAKLSALTPPLRLVFHDSSADIYELPAPRAYFATDRAGCGLTIRSRTALEAECNGSASLTRRELFYPGWHAYLNGREVRLSEAPPIFQRIDLPAGKSIIEFRYRPTNIGWAYTGGAFGCLWILLAWIRTRRSAGGFDTMPA